MSSGLRESGWADSVGQCYICEEKLEACTCKNQKPYKTINEGIADGTYKPTFTSFILKENK